MKKKARNSLSKMFHKVSALRNFAEFRGKHLHWSLFFHKVADWMLATFSKKETQVQLFSCQSSEFWGTFNFKNTFFTEHLRTNASDLLTEFPINFRSVNEIFNLKNNIIHIVAMLFLYLTIRLNWYVPNFCKPLANCVLWLKL